MNFLHPEFFDIFGLGVFSFLSVAAVWALRTHRPLPDWVLWVVLGVGIAGLIVDGTIVWKTYLKRKR